jgi:death-on-curing protein
MEIGIDKDTLILFHDVLIDLYRDTKDPIALGQSESIVDVCAERPFTDIYDFIPFPHILHKASVLMDTIIHFHPFIDGNKRVALLSTFYLLYWNGYDLRIPEDAPLFTVEIAEGKQNLNSILSWLTHNCIRNFRTIYRNLILSSFLSLSEELEFATLTGALLTPMFFTSYPFMFFRYLIAKKAKQSNSKKT